MAGNLAFDILARDKASKTFDKIGKSADQTGRKFGHLGARSKGVSAGIKTGFGAAAGAMAAIGAGQLLKGFIDEAREAQKVTRLTSNVIKTTGGVANVTAGHVAKLAESISNKTAIDDETIQSSANLLLTFKNVRNEAGKGAQVFDRATAAAVDLSAAGFGSVDGAAKMLGKALNDPIKGISALSRAGVTFTAQQKEQIKTLVESGKTLEAQKIIMKEVESQVGGAGKAAADPMQRLGVVVQNVQEKIGAKLLPFVEKAAVWLGNHLPGAIDKVVAFFEEKLVPAFKAIWEVIGPGVKATWEHVLKPALQGLGWAIGKIPEALQWLHETSVTVWSAIGSFFATAAIGIIKVFRAITMGILNFGGIFVEVGNVVGVVSDDTKKNFENYRRNVDTTMGGAINSLNDWRENLRKAPKVVELKGKIKDLDKKIADAKEGIKSVPKEKRSEFKGKLDDLIAKRKAAQREIDKLRGKTVKVGLAGLPDINATFNALKGLGSSAAGGLIPGPSSDRDNHLRMMATGEYVVRAKRVNHSTLPILEMINQEGRVPEGYAKGGVVANTNYKGALAMPQIQRYARDLRGAIPDVLGILAGTVKKLYRASGGKALSWARSQEGKPYGWGAVGPSAYDCSGFMSAIVNVIKGRNPHSRLGSTGTFPWSGFAPGGGRFMIGSVRGNPGHMAGSLNGVNVESRGGDGVVVGGSARGARSGMFGGNVWHLKGYAKGGLVTRGDAPFDLIDPRGLYAMRQYRNGTSWVPQDGPAYLHKGEAVVPAEVNKARMSMPTADELGAAIRKAVEGMTLVIDDQGRGRLTARNAGLYGRSA